MCQAFGHFRGLLHHLVLAKLTTTSIRVNYHFCAVISGVSTTVTPVYLSEISPKHIRGATGTINQFTIVLGVLVSQALGLRHILGTKDLWHVLLGEYKVNQGCPIMSTVQKDQQPMTSFIR